MKDFSMQLQNQSQAHLLQGGNLQLLRIRTSIALAALAALSVPGCGSGGVQVPTFASGAGGRAIAKYDANKDGSLDYQELAKAPGLRAGVATIKKLVKPRNPAPPESQLQSAKITALEIDARINEWKKHGTGRIKVMCCVKRKGTSEPVAGAEVKFVPEDFLGSGLPVGSGTTDSKGYAQILPRDGAKDDALGLFPGFYRVEITKGNEIPAKYNTATELGQEVAVDALGISTGGVVFELSY
jgi:hypothetical protein